MQLDIWGKGHPVTKDSEEFQRLVPVSRETGRATHLQRHMDHTVGWPSVLIALARSSSKTVAEQYAVLFQPDEAAIVVARSGRDGAERSSIFVFVGYCPISWSDTTLLARDLHNGRALLARLASEMTPILSGSNAEITGQLRDGAFLSTNCYDLSTETVVEDPSWVEIVSAVSRWKGVAGVATPRLLGVGANVILGTRHEATQQSADGFYDPKLKEFVPVGGVLVPWHQHAKDELSNDEPSPTRADSVSRQDEIDDLRRRIEVLETAIESASVQRSRDIDEMRTLQRELSVARNETRRTEEMLRHHEGVLERIWRLITR